MLFNKLVIALIALVYSASTLAALYPEYENYPKYRQYCILTGAAYSGSPIGQYGGLWSTVTYTNMTPVRKYRVGQAAIASPDGGSDHIAVKTANFL